MKKDYFSHKSKEYEKDEKRVDNVTNIAQGIEKSVQLNKEDVLLDFGSGTGLLTERIAKHVGKIIANDVSESMNEQLDNKIQNNLFACEIEHSRDNLCTTDVKFEPLDGIISSMTIHHVEDVKALFKKFHTMLKPNGFIALADLEKEDGSFHKDDTGVFHFGFDKDEFAAWAKECGFSNVNIQTVSIAQKPHGDYPIFLLTAQK